MIMSFTHPCMKPVQTLDNKIKEYEVERHALFFTDPDARRIYKENVKYTVLRRNSINGRIYKDDPTIFSWGLLNEPRCETWKARCPLQLVCRQSQRVCGFDGPPWSSTAWPRNHTHVPSLSSARRLLQMPEDVFHRQQCAGILLCDAHARLY